MMQKLLAATMLLGISGSTLAFHRNTSPSAAAAAAPCRIQGAWERVATIQASKRTEFTGARQTKFVGKKHYMWLAGETRRDTLPLRTVADTARFYAMSGGFGTYELVGDHYTEHLDVFVDPKLEGKTLKASCRVDGNRWYHTFLESDLAASVAGRPPVTDSVTEVWRRVE